MSDERKVQEVMARYTRATDWRDGKALAALFLADAVIEVYSNDQGNFTMTAELEGAAQIEGAMTNMMRPHPVRGWSHHTTYDYIIDIDGDDAHLDAQFITFESLGDEEPQEGWTPSDRLSRGTITPVESGYYRPTLRRTVDGWRIRKHIIINDLPMVF